MTTKPAPPKFMPAPRARPINSGETAQALIEATRDLGFQRKTSAEEADPAESQAPEPVAAPEAKVAPVAPVAIEPKAIAAPKVTKPVAKPKAPPAKVEALGAQAALKFDIPSELSRYLKVEAANRGATVKFLILEALSEKGYPVDMANTPEDGRRPRRD